jgi:ATP-binding cassette, subfamily B, bacterial
MNRDVYKHLLKSHLHRKLFWVSFTMEAIRTLVVRVYVVVLFADITGAVAAGDFEEARNKIILYTIVSLIAGVIGSVGEMIGFKTENNAYEVGTTKFYKKLVNKDLSFYKNSHSGYLTTAYRQYLDGNILIARSIRSEFLKAFISLTAPVVILLIVVPEVGIIMLGVIVIQLIYIVWSSSKAQKYRVFTSEIYRKLSGEVNDDITNIVAFKSAAKEDTAYKHIAERGKQETNAFWLRRKTTILLDLPRTILTSIMVGFTFIVALDSTDYSPDAVGILVLTLFYTFQILRNVADIPDLIGRHDDLVTKVAPTLSILEDSNETIADPLNPAKLIVSGGSIEIKNVSFSYDDNDKVLNSFSLNIGAGETVGVVGLSGAGKSTLASLLMRFDDVSSGSISIDGTDIRSVKQRDLRSAIAYVPQEPLLFHRTIRKNIGYMNTKASKEEIVRAAKAAHAHEFIQQLPNGYDTVVGERGIKLSGGQKQRIVIARAILKNAPIILFDEATSALDSESEHIIQKALPEIVGEHTAVIIAHRLSTVAGLDRIVVIHDGKIEEQGTHAQLLNKKGRYYYLWQKQTNV